MSGERTLFREKKKALLSKGRYLYREKKEAMLSNRGKLHCAGEESFTV
jgi:hypothetical protein